MADDITIHVPSDQDWDDIYATMVVAFNEEGGEEGAAAERLAFEAPRSLVARRDGTIVGTAGIFTRQLSVPGGLLPAAHVTFVSVLPTARRQGVLTRFIHQQFADARAAGEPLAVLWASEGRIYQRFGYGQAVRLASMDADAREVRISTGAGAGRLREGSPTELRDAMAAVYAAAYVDRPGWSERAPRHWDYRLADPPSWRRGLTQLRAVLHEDGSGVDGYALWRVQGDWTDAGPAGSVRVLEVVAANPSAYTSLWNFLLTVDLTRSTKCRILSVDEPLQFMVNEPRRLGLTTGDALWLRILDLPAALAGRRYAAAVDVVLEVTDPILVENSGRWRLRGGPDGATCTATTDAPDLACDVRELGAAYLGGAPLTALADTGAVREVRPGALAEASVALRWSRTPSVVEVF